MTRATGATAGADDGFSRQWERLRADGEIQFTPIEPPKPPERPEWLDEVVRFLARLARPVGEALAALGDLIGLSATALAWTAGAIGAALVLFLLYRMFGQSALARQRRKSAPEDDAWLPLDTQAQALLDDADRLAQEGRFDEATHLLLRRTVQQIVDARPGLLEPSSTAREISALPALPAGARSAFAVIAERVERSLFALRSLSAEDWQAARSAYARFALAGPDEPA